MFNSGLLKECHPTVAHKNHALKKECTADTYAAISQVINFVFHHIFLYICMYIKIEVQIYIRGIFLERTLLNFLIKQLRAGSHKQRKNKSTRLVLLI